MVEQLVVWMAEWMDEPLVAYWAIQMVVISVRAKVHVSDLNMVAKMVVKRDYPTVLYLAVK